jgi:hypothetical protein
LHDCEVTIAIRRIPLKVFVLTELLRVQKKGRDNRFGPFSGRVQQRLVAGVQSAERGNDSDRRLHGQAG